MRAAVIVFCLLVLGTITVGQYYSFWTDLLPYLTSNTGPAGLDSEFAVGLAVEGISAAVQIAIAFLIFDMIANRHRRTNKKRKRTSIADDIVDIYTDFLEGSNGQPWPLNDGSVFRTRLREDSANLLIKNHEGLEPSIIKSAQEGHKNFDRLFFTTTSDRPMATNLADADSVIRHFRDLLKALGYRNNLPFIANPDRKEKLTELRNAMRSRLEKSYGIKSGDFDESVTTKLLTDPQTDYRNTA